MSFLRRADRSVPRLPGGRNLKIEEKGILGGLRFGPHNMLGLSLFLLLLIFRDLMLSGEGEKSDQEREDT